MPASNSAANLKSSQQGPKFAWDHDVPDTPFWRDVDFRISATFLSCFESHELEAIPFDANANLDEPDKLRFLLGFVQSKYTACEAAAEPEKLHVADPAAWGLLMKSLVALYGHLGLQDEEARTIHTMLSVLTGDNRIQWLNILSDLELRLGHFVQAETLIRGVLPWMQTQANLGVDSPQAMGATRRLIESLWMQGESKREEARHYIAELSGLIEGLRDSKFAKYQDEERGMLEELLSRLTAS
ncbi:unnamed protein product [Discula destructiva]